ncbi:MAG: glycosyltransferase family 4 protein [Verrucomicrobiota bacterium]
MKFLFYLPSRFGEAVQDWDYAEKHPMGGSESLVLRLAQWWKAAGHEARICTKWEDCASATCDVFISMRTLEPFQSPLSSERLNYLWCQDDTDQPFLQPLRDVKVAEYLFHHCDAIILPSHYALTKWAKELHAPVSKLEMIPNSIPLERFQKIDVEKLRQRPPRAYYASTPQRGLKELTQSWPRVLEKVPEAHLHVASSMKMYNSEDNASLQELFDQVQKLPNTTYVGAVNQAEIRNIATQCRALAYPCTFAETGCLSAMEAMASGCAVVATALGALPETAWRNPLVEFSGDWLSVWTRELVRIFTDDEYYADIARGNLHIAERMSTDVIAQHWLLRIQSDFAARGLKI